MAGSSNLPGLARRSLSYCASLHVQPSQPILGGTPPVISFSYGTGTFLGVEFNGQFQVGGGKVATNQKFAVAGTEVTSTDPFGVPFFPGGTKVNAFSIGGGGQGILVRVFYLA